MGLSEDAKFLLQLAAPIVAVVVSAIISRRLDERSHKQIDAKLNKIMLNGHKLREIERERQDG